MDTPRIKTAHPRDYVPSNTFNDFQWVRENRDELFEEYGRCVILVYEQKVVGTGKTLQAAIDDAEQRLAPEIKQITPIIEFIGRHQRLSRLRATGE